MLSYQTQRMLAIAVAMLLSGWAIIQVADPADFGMTPIVARWLGVIMSMLGVAAGFLPSVRGMSTKPEFLANRVAELPEHDRQRVVQDVQERTDDAPALPPLAPTAEEIAAAYDRLRRIRAAERLREMGRS